MQNNTQKIYLKDLLGKNIYVRLEFNIQKKLFSKFSNKDFNLDYSKFYKYKTENLAFPLDLLFNLLKKSSLNEFFIYKYILEIKRGQRSKPFLNPKFPIKEDPYYWNILFALFCDGSSDQWCSVKNIKMELPAYTSYSDEIRNSFIKIVKHKFGNFKYKVYDGSVKLPPILDTYFRSQHDINSFNTKSTKISQFILTDKFNDELNRLDNLNKISILVRYLVDEGDKSKISLNPRTINLSISSTSKSLVDILEIVLTKLKLQYNIVYRERNNEKWKNSYLVQIKKGENRDNLKLLYYWVLKLKKHYSLVNLTNLQNKSLYKAINYRYRSNENYVSHSKEVYYLIYKYLLSKKRVTFKEINKMLLLNNFDLTMGSILNVLSKMPLYRRKEGKESIIYVDKEKLKSYLPYSQKQIAKVNYYREALYLYKNCKNISIVSRKLNIPWATIRDWVYGKAKPSILHGKWLINESPKIR